MIYNAVRWGCSAAKSAKCQPPALGANGHREGCPLRFPTLLPHFQADPQIPQLPLTHGLILIPIPVRVLVLGLSFNRRAVRKLKVYVNFDKSLHY